MINRFNYYFTYLSALAALTVFAMPSSAECRDFDAIAAANEKAASYFKDGEVFHPAVVQKVHNTSGRKEIASYIKTGEKRYSIFTLVDAECKVKFRKRTRQGD
jgi:hypothetical protein